MCIYLCLFVYMLFMIAYVLVYYVKCVYLYSFKEIKCFLLWNHTQVHHLKQKSRDGSHSIFIFVLCPCLYGGSSRLQQASAGSASLCCCLVKAASSGRGLVVTSGSLIKWIWFLRGNSRLLSPGARPTLVSIWLTCVGCWDGGLVCVCVCVCERESVSMYSIQYI